VVTTLQFGLSPESVAATRSLFILQIPYAGGAPTSWWPGPTQALHVGLRCGAPVGAASPSSQPAAGRHVRVPLVIVPNVNAHRVHLMDR